MVAPSRLRRHLDRLADSFGPDHLDTDPLAEVRRFRGAGDREVAAFVASGLAFGRVKAIRSALRDLWSRLEEAPARTVDQWGRDDRRRLVGFRYRWVDGDGLALVLGGLGRLRRRHGSLRDRVRDLAAAHPGDLRAALAAFVADLESEVRREANGGASQPLPRGARAFLADPQGSSACKRLHLFLRWMVRPDDGVDLGLVSGVAPSRLLVPVDTHLARIGRRLGFTTRRGADARTAEEITAALRRIDPHDPVRYDFALSRLGILERCPSRVTAAQCRPCPLLPVCVRGRKNRVIAARGGKGKGV